MFRKKKGSGNIINSRSQQILWSASIGLGMEGGMNKVREETGGFLSYRIRFEFRFGLGVQDSIRDDKKASK